MKNKWIPGYEKKYFATKEGEIFRVLNNGKTRQLKGYKKGQYYCVKLTGEDGTKEKQFQRVIWETFNGSIPNGYVVFRKSGHISNNALDNLAIRSKRQQGKLTGATARSKKVELLNDKGEVVEAWTSARKAAKALHCSDQTIIDYCNQKIAKPMFNVRWA